MGKTVVSATVFVPTCEHGRSLFDGECEACEEHVHVAIYPLSDGGVQCECGAVGDLTWRLG